MVLTWQFPPPIAFTTSPSTNAWASLYPSSVDGCPTISLKEKLSFALIISSSILEQVIFILLILFLCSSTIGVEKLFNFVSIGTVDSLLFVLSVLFWLSSLFTLSILLLSSERVILEDILVESYLDGELLELLLKNKYNSIPNNY